MPKTNWDKIGEIPDVNLKSVAAKRRMRDQVSERRARELKRAHEIITELKKERDTLKKEIENIPAIVKKTLQETAIKTAEEMTKEYFMKRVRLKDPDVFRLGMQLCWEEAGGFDREKVILKQNANHFKRWSEKLFDASTRASDSKQGGGGMTAIVNFIGIDPPKAIEVKGVDHASINLEDRREVPCIDAEHGACEGHDTEESEIPGEVAQCD